jgi:dienelactone hydrolase
MTRAVLLFVLLLLLAGCGKDSPEAPPAADGDVNFEGTEGELQGTVFEAKGREAASIVLAHQNGADRSSWFDFAPDLADAGYTALAFDFSGEDLNEEVAAAAEYLQKRGSGEVFLIGASKGATASLLAAAEGRDIAGIVSLSGVLSFEGLEVTQEAMQSIKAPVLLLVGADDDYASDSEQLEEWNAHGELIVYEGVGDHGTDLLSGEAADRARGDILDFLEKSS